LVLSRFFGKKVGQKQTPEEQYLNGKLLIPLHLNIVSNVGVGGRDCVVDKMTKTK
jgi:hypothetical protein